MNLCLLSVTIIVHTELLGVKIYSFLALISVFLIPISAQRCEGGESADALCPMGICSGGSGTCRSGIVRRCGSDISFATADGGEISRIVSASIFDQMLEHRDDSICFSSGFFSYIAFITAASSFIGFGTTGNPNTRKMELAAFLAQTSHETTGSEGWDPGPPDGPYAWGYCHANATDMDSSYCNPSSSWPCASGKKYYGRGPFRITYNFNYGAAGKAIGVDLLNNPDLAATDPIISFKTALWFWMTPQGNRPSCHDVITGKWKPSDEDTSAGRLPGYGVITNLINGGLECGRRPDARVADRIGFYKRYCDILGVGYGDNIDCQNQKPFV